jgi:peptidoglycan/LPS O-acetylase OafA/YrhL
VLNGALAFLPSLLTVPVIVGLVRPGRLTTVLSTRPPVWFGKRSYSLYLWHFPILSIAINQAPASIPVALRLVGAVVAAVVAADLSYRYVELPVLRRRPRSPAIPIAMS